MNTTDLITAAITAAVREAVREEVSQLVDQLKAPNPSPVDGPEFLSTLQVAEITGINENTLRRWRSDDDPAGPPYVRFGRAVRYRRSDIDQWANSPFSTRGRP
ncbi:hypothetical protein B842_03510 [Corynebacterium humireducens NBRC 106098 = DSM 45392]|uniref:Helix-turn-helix domain-containing protein n=1 Tax=Corynebacterium humireducens NBRC 106098 = DSM 45392 TaxID=1223515 RepID=A0A0B5D148_9CORY|nr:helix-turn-helix domain-containing protein [Corynebacterium humireducens]AJE32555.1 hypothetical protein B842_03510 [Corynebacterium humireducens NBRC 106098 = DSM 45392]